jgi:hypothetical protein
LLRPYPYKDGNDVLDARFLPGLSESEIQGIEAGLGAPLPVDYRQLLSQCSGIEGLLPEIDFSGALFRSAFWTEFTQHGLAFAGDGCGNFWCVDCLSKQEERAQLHYWSHDPPIMLYQCDGMDIYLKELIRMSQPPNESLIGDVSDDRLFDVWGKNPVERAQELTDPVLLEFKAQLGEGWIIVDMRHPQPGFGFSWGRSDPQTDLKRFGEERIFAYYRPPKKPSIFDRLFGRK